MLRTVKYITIYYDIYKYLVYLCILKKTRNIKNLDCTDN